MQNEKKINTVDGKKKRCRRELEDERKTIGKRRK